MTDFNRLIHEPVRLFILTYLAKSEDNDVSFSELKNELGISSGNLSVQLNKLKDYGYINMIKSFQDNRPLTSIEITSQGISALTEYFDKMEKMIKSFRE